MFVETGQNLGTCDHGNRTVCVMRFDELGGGVNPIEMVDENDGIE